MKYTQLDGEIKNPKEFIAELLKDMEKMEKEENERVQTNLQNSNNTARKPRFL